MKLSFLFSIFTYFQNIGSLNNVEFIKNHSKDLPYQVEENQFINREYKNEFYDSNISYNNTNYNVNDTFEDVIVPFNVDWRKKGVVSSVKNQLKCGGCWAFSSAEAVESIWAINNKQLYNLSEQELIDCTTSYGNHGCEGGSMLYGFQYVVDNGLCTNISYPYVAQDQMCSNITCDKVVKIHNFSLVEQNNENILKRAVAQNPVSVAIQANKRSFQFYQSGIYNDIDCGYELDHGVLLVGYGYDFELDMKYWIIKNSWGEEWGDNGYIRIQRNIDDSRGLCGIAMQPSIPII